MKKLIAGFVFALALSGCQDAEPQENSYKYVKAVVTASECSLDDCQTGLRIVTPGPTFDHVCAVPRLLGVRGDTILIQAYHGYIVGTQCDN